MLRYRIPAAIIILGLFGAALWFDTTHAKSTGMSIFMAVGTVVVLREFYAMVEAKGAKPLTWFGIAMGVLLVFSHDRWCWEKWHGYTRSTPDLMTTVLAICVLGACLLQALRKSPDGTILNIGSTLMGLVYVWFLPGFLLKLRHLEFAGVTTWQDAGYQFVIITIVVAKISDVGAYFTGRFFGRHKMSPIISPKKTWEGAAGGVAASVILTIVFRAVWKDCILTALPLWGAVIFGIIMAVSSMLGDLLASCMKRDSQMKDSGASVPGFGGMLDVVDSLMVAAPLSYFFFLVAGAHPPHGAVQEIKNMAENLL